MTTASEPGAGERRLHPLSWLFVLLQQLKQFALPLLVLLLAGRGDRNELWPLIGVAGLTLYAGVQYLTYRFRLDHDGIVIRSGWLQKTVRHIPFERIHNVALHQSLLHRLFGVAEVRLESAGGQASEGQMRVLSLADARALEDLVRAHGQRSSAVDGPNTPSMAMPAESTLLALDIGEVIRLGLISNRGMIVMAAGIGVLSQVGSELLGRQIKALFRQLFGWAMSTEVDILGWLAGGLLLFLLFVLVLRVLSVLLALLQFHGFRLTESGRRLVLQRGLLTLMRSSLSRPRIQAFSLSEGLLHRLFGRQSLRVDSAGGAAEAEPTQNTPRDLVPLATPATMDRLLVDLLAPGQWPIQGWLPLHPRAWRRQLTLPLALTLIATGVLAWRHGPVAGLLLLMLPLWWLRAKTWARHAGYAEQAGLIAVREGWLGRHWRFAQVRKLQSLQLTQSPFDRRHGMASLHLDTVGAGPMEPPLRIRYLPLDEARALQLKLASMMGA